VDPFALVDEQIAAGKKLIERLNQEGIAVVAGGWVKESDRDRWYLYLITPLVGEDGATRATYRRVVPVIRQLQEEGTAIDFFEVKVIGPKDPVAVPVLQMQRNASNRLPIRYPSTSLGGLSIEGAYFYPPPVRQA